MIREDVSKGYAPKEISFMGYTTKNMSYAPDAAKAFEDTISRVNKGLIKNSSAVLTALKHTDQYMKINDDHLKQNQAPDSTDVEQWKHAHKMARDALNSIGEFAHHFDYWHNHEHELELRSMDYTPQTAGDEMVDSYNPEGSLTEELTDKTIKPSDKIKVARVIADMLGVEKAESMSPENAINTGLRKMKMARLTPELKSVLSKMLHLAQSVGINYDQTLVKEAATVVPMSKTNIASDILSFDDYIKLANAQSMDKTKDAPHQAVGHSLHADPSHPTRKMKVKYKIDEDQDSADYKTSASGKKYRAHRLDFKNSSSSDMMVGDKKDEEEPAVKIKPMTKKIKEEADDLEEGLVKKINKKAKNLQDIMKGQDTGKAAQGSWQEKRAASLRAGRAMRKEEVDDNGLDDISDDELDTMANSVNHEDHIMDAYDDDEFTFVDLDTGEEVEQDDEEEGVNEALMMEVLSRVERMRAKTRFRQTKSKRERRMQLVLRRRSDTKTINKRARRLAINMMKQRIMKKSPSQLTVTEKERVERMLQSRKPSIDRLAMRLAPRVRQIESQRLSHSQVTKG